MASSTTRSQKTANKLRNKMIALPGQLLYTTQIPVSLWFLTKNKKNSFLTSPP